MTVHPVPTDDNTADMFTKALGPIKFCKFRTALGIKDVHDELAKAKGGKPKSIVQVGATFKEGQTKIKEDSIEGGCEDIRSG